MKRIIITEQQKNKIIELCSQGFSYPQIAKYFNLSLKVIRRFCVENNIKNRFCNRSYRNGEIDNLICKLYNDGYNSVYISNYMNLSIDSVLRALRENNVSIKDRHKCQQKHSYDENYFQNIDSFKKAYWLGFISGDGGIYKNSLSINLSEKDIVILQQFKKDLECTQPISLYNYSKGSFSDPNKKYCNITITSPIMLDDLKKYGIVNRKSKSLQIKNIPEHYVNGFILGLIDADGCFRVNKLGDVSLSLIGNLDLVKYVQEQLIKNCKLNKTKLIKHHSTKEMFYLEYAGNLQMQRIYHFLYNNAEFYLPRKHDRIVQCFKKKSRNTCQKEH